VTTNLTGSGPQQLAGAAVSLLREASQLLEAHADPRAADLAGAIDVLDDVYELDAQHRSAP